MSNQLIIADTCLPVIDTMAFVTSFVGSLADFDSTQGKQVPVTENDPKKQSSNR